MPGSRAAQNSTAPLVVGGRRRKSDCQKTAWRPIVHLKLQYVSWAAWSREFGQRSVDCRWQSLVQTLPLFGSSTAAVVRRKVVTLGAFWQSSCRCTLPPWMYLTTGRPTRSSVFWTRWRLTTGIRPAPRPSSCGALACGSPRSSSWNGGTWITLGGPATLLIRRSKTRKGRTVRLHPELVQPVHQLAGEPVAAGQAGAAQHADGAPAHRGWDRMGGPG